MRVQTALKKLHIQSQDPSVGRYQILGFGSETIKNRKKIQKLDVGSLTPTLTDEC